MDGVSVAASIGAIIQITGTVIKYIDAVKGADRDRTRLRDELDSIYASLRILEDRCADEADSWNVTLRSLKSPDGPLEQLGRTLESLSRELEPAERLRRVGKSFRWPFKEKDVKDLLASIERQKGLLILARQNDHIELSKAIRNSVKEVSHDVDKIRESIQEIQISTKRHAHDHIYKWLSAPDPSLNFQRALRLRQSNTGLWLLQNPAYIDWKVNPGNVLWLYGIPGCGKTVLSSTVLEEIVGQCQSDSKAAVLYFYFDFNDGEKQRHDNMMRSLAEQLSAYYAEVPKVLDSLYKGSGNGLRQPSHDSLSAVLHQMMTNFEDIYIILDALDECNNQSELLNDIEKFHQWRDIKLHILSTSRREKDIEESMRTICSEEMSIGLQTALVNEDIRDYVHAHLQADRRFRRWQNRPKIRLEIEDVLMGKANGMFRWAVCQLDSLAKCINVRQIHQELKSLPKDLDGTYERILCGISDLHCQSAMEILQWLAFSARPLLLQEVAEVVTIDVDRDPRVDPDTKLLDARDVLTICSSLVSIGAGTVDDEKLYLVDYASKFDSVDTDFLQDNDFSDYVKNPEQKIHSHHVVVRLAHFSVKEFLVSDRISKSPAKEYRIDEIHTNKLIAEMCLAYLLQFDSADRFTKESWDQSNNPPSVTREDQSRFPLALYSAKYWPNHTLLAEKVHVEKIPSLSLEFLLTNGAEKENWIRLCCPDPLLTLHGPKMENDASTTQNIIRCLLESPLHCSSFLGLSKLTSVLLEESFHVEGNMQDDNFPSPLYLACRNRCMTVVELLLAQGAKCNINYGRLLGNSLCTATARNSPEIVLLLLKNGAEVNMQSYYLGAPLNVASLEGCYHLAEILLQNGADVNARGRFHGSALNAALHSGHIKLARLLIEHGADVNCQDAMVGSSIQAASDFAVRGSIDVIRLLIEKGADIDTSGGSRFHGNLLQLAITDGSIDTVRLLIEKGARVNAKGGAYGYALQAASYTGNLNIIRLLIEKGADVNAYGGKYITALQASIRGGDDEVAACLRANGAKELEDLEGGRTAAGLEILEH